MNSIRTYKSNPYIIDVVERYNRSKIDGWVGLEWWIPLRQTIRIRHLYIVPSNPNPTQVNRNPPSARHFN